MMLPPAHRRPRFVLWLMLLVCLLIASPALLVDISRPHVVDEDEAIALATLSETHARLEGREPFGGLSWVERYVPYMQGRALNQPPALTWLQLAAVSLLPNPPDGPADFILAARLLSCVLAGVTITCIFWAGHCIGGRRTALFAGLIVATNPALIYFGRLATPAILLTALAMLAIASALWAIRPLRASPSVFRQGLGWATCGLALGAANFTIGLAATLIIVLPILLMLLLCPDRISHLMGMIAAMLIAALMVVTWIAFSQAHVIGVPWWWKTQALTIFWINQDWGDFLRQLARNPGWILLAMLPWSVWLLGAFFQPFSSSSAGARLRMFMGWGWFLTLFVLLLFLPAAADHASLLVTLAAGAVMVGVLLDQYNDLAKVGRYPRVWRILRWYHLILVVGALSIALPLAVHYQPLLVKQGWISVAWLADPGLWFCVGWGVGMLAVMALSFRWALQNYPSRATVAWACWGMVALLVLTMLWARGPISGQAPPHGNGNGTHMAAGGVLDVYEEGDSVLTRTRNNLRASVAADRRKIFRKASTMYIPVYWLAGSPPDPAMTFYSQLYTTPIEPSQVPQLIAERTPFDLLATQEDLLSAAPELANQPKVGVRLPGEMVLWSFNTTMPDTSSLFGPVPASGASTQPVVPSSQ